MSELCYWKDKATRLGAEVKRLADKQPGSEAHRLALADLRRAEAELARCTTSHAS